MSVYMNPVKKEMTYEEAQQALLDVLCVDIHYDESLDYQLTSDDIEWLIKAKESLDKQIPVKPTIKQFNEADEITEEFYTFKYFLCGKCGAHIGYFLCGKCGAHIGVRTNQYCSDCGQKIEWGDES